MNKRIEKSFKPWRPGYVSVETLPMDVARKIDQKKCTQLLVGIQLQIEMMMDSSLREYNRAEGFKDYKPD